MTDKLRDAAQQALEVLEELQGGCTDSDDGTVEVITVWCPEVIDTLRAALAQQDAQNAADEVWRKLFWQAALKLKCLPSSYPDANGHVLRAIDRLMGSENAQQDAQKKHKPLFAEMIAQHPGLAEELAQQGAQVVPPSDTDLRRLWAAHAAKMHGWASNAIPAMHDTGNGPRFECSWHEQEFGVFKAGYLAASQSAPTPPAQRVMLTDEEIERIYTEETGSFIDDSPWALKDFARAIIEAYERKNGIK